MMLNARRIRRAIGVDPGSTVTGYGVVELHGNRIVHVGSGVVRLGRKDFLDRLEILYRELHAICSEYQPDEAAIEALFHHKNSDSALKLGHARGAALLALRHQGLTVHQYEPSRVKKYVTGYGAADKSQVEAMVRMMLGELDLQTHDQSDALAIAICHLHHNPLMSRTHL